MVWGVNRNANVLQSVHMIWKVSGWSEKCPDYLQSAWMIWKVSEWFKKRHNEIKSVQMIWIVSEWSIKYPDDLENVQMIHQMCFSLFIHILPNKNPDSFVSIIIETVFLRTYVAKLTISLFRHCALSKKFLRGKSCYPESFRFFWLWLGADLWY